MGKTVVIMQSNYLPWRGYFDLMKQADTFVIYDEVQYTKNDWRNRNVLKSANGPIWLTIPVKKGHLNQSIDSIEVAHQPWKTKHLKTISQNYRRSKNYPTVYPLLERTYADISSNLLSDINLSLILFIRDFLGIETSIVNSRQFNASGSPTEKLVEICRQLGATIYLSGPAAKSYLEPEPFAKQNIHVRWMDYSHYGEYPQLYPPFQQNVSIIDLLFNLDPRFYSQFNKVDLANCTDQGS